MTWQRTSSRLEEGEVVVALVILTRSVAEADLQAALELGSHHLARAGLDLMFFEPGYEAKLRKIRRRWWRPKAEPEVQL